mgnify:CR=1 FL=1
MAKLKDSLKNQMLKMTIIPLTAMILIIIIAAVSTLYTSLVNQVKEELIDDANLAVLIYDKMYTGEFNFVENEDGTVDIYKGEEPITGDNILLDDLADILSVEISVFFRDTRILTTLTDADGNRAVGTTAATLVKKNVLETGEDAFYTNVLVYNERSFAYYMPLQTEDGEVYGMIAVAREENAVRHMALSRIWPVVLVCILTAFVIGAIMVHYNKKLAARISAIDRFMNVLANGEFDADMPPGIMKKDDEIKRLATDGKKMARSIKTLVEYDALTQLNNRRFADKKLEDIRVRSAEMGIKYCLCISDIDFFKKVNDTYGHEMGDTILKTVAEKLKKGMVGKGFAARWGGEEFLLIFEGRQLDIAKRELTMIMDDIRTIYVPGTDRQITMSFGLTSMQPSESVDDALKRADANLYEAKEGGRNQIVSS